MKNKLYYRNMYIDMSWILTRNLSMVLKDKGMPDLNYVGDIMKLTFQTIRRFGRDFGVIADKIILVLDNWINERDGYYRTKYLKEGGVQFKKRRTYYYREDLEKLLQDPTATQEQIHEMEYGVKKDELKKAAKEAIYNEFPKLGIYVYRKPGYEFDDIVSTASLMRGQTYKAEEKKDIIVATDSDVMYSLSPGCDMFRPKIGKTNPERLITYNDMITEIPQELVDRGINLYYYHAFRDSLGYGHNDLVNPRKLYADFTETVVKILNNDFSNLKPDMIDIFKVQYSTFDISTFPGFNELQSDIKCLFNKKGIIGSLDTLHTFCNKYGITRISDEYYTDFTSTLDERYYCEL